MGLGAVGGIVAAKLGRHLMPDEIGKSSDEVAYVPFKGGIESIKKAANLVAQDPAFINGTREDQRAILGAKAKEILEQEKNNRNANLIANDLMRRDAKSNRAMVNDDEYNPFLHVSPYLHVSPSKVVHNVPYYIAGNNPDFSDYVATKSVPKMANKLIPGAAKVPYYLEKQE
jgi:hypothetical protein